ncbi:MAG: cation diffusion facilitator family transporter [Alphaproteobacteria bacterium]|nr:cation diffusion facilitator family transporter [Alphaproteobacteria bacterium]
MATETAPANPSQSRAATPGLRPGTTEAYLVRTATYASFAVAVTLIVTKFLAWRVTGSVSLLGSLLDSSLDLMASLISLFAVRHALVPADREHRFGHGKAEALAALGQALFVGASAVALLVEAGRRIVLPRYVDAGGWAVAVMALSLVLTVLLVRYQKYVVERTGSLAISADSLHYTTDILINGSILLGLVAVVGLGWTLLDPLLAIAVSIYLFYSAWRIARTSFDHLMDRELDDEVRKDIRAIVLSHKEVRAMHDLRTRSSGMYSFIQLHLELDASLTLLQAHRISDEVERMINAKYPTAEVLIHEDPAGVGEVRATFA